MTEEHEAIIRARYHAYHQACEALNPSGMRVHYDVMPIYSGNEEADREGIDRAVLFGLISVSDQLGKRLDTIAVSTALTAAQASAVA